tara:strand:- start:12890 stop:14329 length:1440 start_codon:yes stop_codon:yes gene_type:complete
MTNSLYWYDYETFGTNASRDCISQFAGIRTNEKLEIISEPLTIYCQPPIDRLPIPEACLVTGITPQIAQEKGIPEREFIQKVHQELSFPDTCGVGYNSIAFDDEFTRYALFRNFYDPYLREREHGNSRWDVMDLLRLTRALRPDGIEWPTKSDGSPCFKLTSLTQANNIPHESAHDALSDVLATIAVAKLVMTKHPKLYDYVYKYRFKTKVQSLVDVCNRKPFLHVAGKLPKENYYAALVLPLAAHPTNKNSTICFNLMDDPKPLVELSAQEIHKRLYSRKGDLQAGQKKFSILEVFANKCPIVATPNLIDKTVAERLGIVISVCEKNHQYLMKHNLVSKLNEVYSISQFEDTQNPEGSLYQGFINKADEKQLSIVRDASAQQLAADSLIFRDKRYQKLLFLYRAKNYPDSLSLSEQATWKVMRIKRLTEGVDGYIMLKDYFLILKELLSNTAYSDRERNILLSLEKWGQEIFDKASME